MTAAMTFETPDISRLRVRSSSPPDASRPRPPVSRSMAHRRVYSLPSLSSLHSSQSAFKRHHTVAPLKSQDSSPRLLPPIRLSPPREAAPKETTPPAMIVSRPSAPATYPTAPRQSVRFDTSPQGTPPPTPGQVRQAGGKRVIMVNASLAAHLKNGGVVNIVSKGKRWRVYLPMRA